MIEVKTTTIPRYIEVLIVLYVFHTTLPAFGYYIPALVHGGTMAFLYFYLMSYDKHFGSNLSKALAIFSVSILSLLYNGLSNFATGVYWLLQIFIYPLLSLYLMRYANEKVLKRMLVAIGLSYLITAVTTYFGNQIFPLASRLIVSTEDVGEVNLYRSYNIGGFNIVYAWVLLLPAVMYMIRNKVVSTYIGIVILIILSATVLAAEYTTALFVLVLTIATLLFIRNIGSKQIIALMVAFVLVVTVFDQYIFPLLANFTGIFGSDQVDERLMELSSFAEGSASFEGDMGSRYDFYKVSWDSFAQSPIWGRRNAITGAHSYVFDTMAQYGLIGVLGLIIMYVQIFKSFYKPFKHSSFFGYALYTFCVALTLAIINPKDNMSVLTFMMPLAATYFTKYLQRI